MGHPARTNREPAEPSPGATPEDRSSGTLPSGLENLSASQLGVHLLTQLVAAHTALSRGQLRDEPLRELLKDLSAPTLALRNSLGNSAETTSQLELRKLCALCSILQAEIKMIRAYEQINSALLHIKAKDPLPMLKASLGIEFALYRLVIQTIYPTITTLTGANPATFEDSERSHAPEVEFPKKILPGGTLYELAARALQIATQVTQLLDQDTEVSPTNIWRIDTEPVRTQLTALGELIAGIRTMLSGPNIDHRRPARLSVMLGMLQALEAYNEFLAAICSLPDMAIAYPLLDEFQGSSPWTGRQRGVKGYSQDFLTAFLGVLVPELKELSEQRGS